MQAHNALDLLVRDRLKTWPQQPPGSVQTSMKCSRWLRGRPTDDSLLAHPFLKFPGTTRLRTLPDGLWLNFAGSVVEPFVDIFAIEACGSLQNLLDKRSRFAPSTHSLLAYCPVPWLLAPVQPHEQTPRWKATGVIRQEPTQPLILPVRDIRVMYGLKPRHYKGFVQNNIPHPHEYFVPMESLTAEGGDSDPAMRALVARASATSNFLQQAS